MDIQELVNTIGGALGILSLITAAVFIFLNRKQSAEKDADASTISSYKSNATALNQLLQTRNAEISELRAKHESNLERIRLAESKADILEKQVTQAPSINKLIIQMGKQHTEIMQQMAAMTGELGNIAKGMPKAQIHNGKGKKDADK